MAKRPKKKTKPMGRPTDFNQKIAHIICELAKEGKTEAEIAATVGIHVNTLYLWKTKHKEFMWALKDSKHTADELVEASLFRKACGYSHDAVKHVVINGSIEEIDYVEHYPPSDVAAIFWLKNRKPDQWREKQPEKPPTDSINEPTEMIIEFQDEVPNKDA